MEITIDMLILLQDIQGSHFIAMQSFNLSGSFKRERRSQREQNQMQQKSNLLSTSK